MQQNASVTAGIDATLLRDGPTEAIVQRIKYYIDSSARDGRCVIFLNQIPAETPPAHIHARAKRFAVKIFISNLHEVWFEKHFGRPAPAPYPFAHLGHTHKIDP